MIMTASALFSKNSHPSEEEIKKAEMKYKAYIKKFTVFELAYKPTNARNEKGKKLIMLELSK